MSIRLSNTLPPDTTAKALDDAAGTVLVGDLEIPASDFCELVRYFLSNTNLRDDDPRLLLVEQIRTTGFSDGWGGAGVRMILGATDTGES